MERLHRAQCGTVSSMSDDQREERRPRGRVLRQVAQEEVIPFAATRRGHSLTFRNCGPWSLLRGFRCACFASALFEIDLPTRPLPEPAPTRGATAATSSQHYSKACFDPEPQVRISDKCRQPLDLGPVGPDGGIEPRDARSPSDFLHPSPATHVEG